MSKNRPITLRFQGRWLSFLFTSTSKENKQGSITSNYKHCNVTYLWVYDSFWSISSKVVKKTWLFFFFRLFSSSSVYEGHKTRCLCVSLDALQLTQDYLVVGGAQALEAANAEDHTLEAAEEALHCYKTASASYSLLQLILERRFGHKQASQPRFREKWRERASQPQGKKTNFPWLLW